MQRDELQLLLATEVQVVDSIAKGWLAAKRIAYQYLTIPFRGDDT